MGGLIDVRSTTQDHDSLLAKIVGLKIGPVPITAGGGFAFERDARDPVNVKYVLGIGAMFGVDTGEMEVAGFLYVQARATITGITEITYISPDEFGFLMAIILEASIVGGVKFKGDNYIVLRAGVRVEGLFERTLAAEYHVAGSAKVYYNVNIFIWDEEGEFMWELKKQLDI